MFLLAFFFLFLLRSYLLTKLQYVHNIIVCFVFTLFCSFLYLLCFTLLITDDASEFKKNVCILARARVWQREKENADFSTLFQSWNLRQIYRIRVAKQCFGWGSDHFFWIFHTFFCLNIVARQKILLQTMWKTRLGKIYSFCALSCKRFVLFCSLFLKFVDSYTHNFHRIFLQYLEKMWKEKEIFLQIKCTTQTITRMYCAVFFPLVRYSYVFFFVVFSFWLLILFVFVFSLQCIWDQQKEK